jgi:DUF1707 SHOCT-like domain
MTNHYLFDRIAGREPNLRAADADRERTAERLRVGHAEGRLDLTEFQERLELCLQAKTVGELDELVRDLPSDNERERSAARFSIWRWPVAPLLPILIAIVVLSAAVGDHVFWLWIPIAFVLWRISWWRRAWAGAWRGPHNWI